MGKPLEIEEQLAKAKSNVFVKDLENVPFVVIGDDEKEQYFGALGEYRLTDFYKTPGGAEKAVCKLNWENISRVMTVLIDKNNKTKFVEE